MKVKTAREAFAFNSLKNPGFSTREEDAKMRALRHEFSDWQELIFLHKRKRLFPKNAILTFMPPELIVDGEASRLPILLQGLSIV